MNSSSIIVRKLWSHLLLFFTTLALFQRSCYGYLHVSDNTVTATRTRFQGPKHHQSSSKKIISGTTALNALPIAPTVASALVVAGVIAFHEGLISYFNVVFFCFSTLTCSILMYLFLLSIFSRLVPCSPHPSLLVHLAGHFFAAKSQGMKIQSFNIGYGPKLYSFNDSSDVEFSLRALPLGGYVSFPSNMEYDEETGEELAEKDDPDLLQNRPPLQRALVISGGVLANFLLTFLLATGTAVTTGLGQPIFDDGLLVTTTASKDAPAVLAGVRVSDVITKINGENIRGNEAVVNEFVKKIRVNADKPIVLEIIRGPGDSKLGKFASTSWGIMTDGGGGVGKVDRVTVVPTASGRYTLSDTVIHLRLLSQYHHPTHPLSAYFPIINIIHPSQYNLQHRSGCEGHHWDRNQCACKRRGNNPCHQSHRRCTYRARADSEAHQGDLGCLVISLLLWIHWKRCQWSHQCG